MTTLRHQYLIAKKWVGIAATNITGNSNAQKSKVIINLDRVYDKLSYQDQQILYNADILLPHNTVDVDGKSYATISKIKVANSDKYISDRLSGYATSFVDVANNPFIMKLVQSNLVVSTFMFLERIGSGEHTIFFLNQPIIREYLKYLDSIDSKSLFSKGNVENFTMSFFMGKNLSTEIKAVEGNEFHNLDNLKQNIKDYYATNGESLNPEKAREQKLIFDEFLKYAKMAEHLFDLSQATNYDTSRFRSGEAFGRKNLRTQIAREKNIFTSVDNLFKSTFLGKQKEFIDKSMQSMGAIFKLEEDRFSIITDSVLRPFQENKYLSNDDFDTIASKVKASFLDYIVQVKLGMNTPSLLTGENSVASQLLKAREENKDVKILHDLEPTLSDRIDGAKSIRLKANIKEASDENMFIEMMRELKELNPILFNNIIKIARLQGSYQSSISINNAMPVDDFAQDIKNIFSTLIASEDIRAFKNGWFQRNNWRDDAIFPELKNTKFAFPEDKNKVPIDEPIGEDPYGNLIYQYTSKLFPYIEDLGVDASNRGILLLHSKYDLFNGANQDYLKVPRVVQLPGTEEQIDLTTGQTLVKAAFRARKNAGDLSLRDMFGYQKVKYPDGTPLVTGKGEYVFKLINLYGDGALFSEYKLDYTPSEIDNGTMKVKQELNDADIIKFYGGIVEEEIVSLPSETPVEVISEQAEPAAVATEEEESIEYTLEEQLQFEINDITQRIAELEYVQQDLDVSNTETIVLNNLPKITPVSARKETGMKTGDKKDVKYTLLSGNGVSVDRAANDIWQSNFGIDSSVTTQDIRNIIIDILSSGSKVNYKSQIGTSSEITNLKQRLRDLNNELSELQKGNPKLRTRKPIPGQLDLFAQEDESWKDEDNNDSCVPF
jgi:hypothetical protein